MNFAYCLSYLMAQSLYNAFDFKVELPKESTYSMVPHHWSNNKDLISLCSLTLDDGISNSLLDSRLFSLLRSESNFGLK